jgi:poly(A) polymerase
MQIAPDQIDPDAAKVVQRLRRYDHAAYLVGGCVRDLLLGLKPKDFDVVTSATPQEIKRLFRNCRIIGRLAHVFFGSKIIETSTFRANPRELEEEESDSPPDTGSNSDLLIRRDNVFGTPEEDARRRDFTINGLFYDLETGNVIDHVNGLVDLEARVVRTIGDPDIRFREDPVRILRAVKFAARCNLSIEPETYRRMMEHRDEIAKCAQARVSEEFYRLLRAGAAKRSVEILVETNLLELMSPELARALKGDDDDDETRLRRARLWAYLSALDRSTARRPVAPSNSLMLAVLLLPPLRDPLDPDSSGIKDIGQLVAQGIQPTLERLRASRRDAELARQILLALRYILPSKQPRRKRPQLAGREFFDEALRLAEIVSDAEGVAPELGGRPILGVAGDAGTRLGEAAAPGDELVGEELAPELEPLDNFERGRRRRRGRGPERGEERPRGNAGGGFQERPAAAAASAFRPPALAPIQALETLFSAAAALVQRSERPVFLGTGAFGGPWSARQD